VRDAGRAQAEPTNRASIRRIGPATTQRLTRDRSRGDQPNDLFQMVWLCRIWRGERGSLRREWAGARAPVAFARELEWSAVLSATPSFNSLFAR